MAITIEGLTKVYPGQVKALDGIDLSIPSGMFGLLGPNGAGKTTLMRILCTLLRPTSGRVSVASFDLTRDAAQIRRVLGYLPQEFGLYKDLTGHEFLDYVAGVRGLRGSERRRQVSDLLQRVNLADVAHRRCGGYSGGMKRRLGIAQALLCNPKVLVVDEPTAGLDPEERIRFRNLLVDLSGERVVILSTHVVSDVESTCTRLAVLQRGRILFRGSPENLAESARGRVWDLDIDGATYEKVKNLVRVVTSRRTSDSVQLRVVSAENPLGLGRPADSGIEEGYLWLMEGIHETAI